MMNNANEKNSIKRAAWKYEKPKLPALSSLFVSHEHRRLFFRAWLMKPIGYAGDFVGHFALKLLPIDACSDLGAYLGRIVVKNKHKAAVVNMRRNLEVMFPEISDEQKEALVTKNCESLGRLMTEFSVLTRLCRDEQRVKAIGLENLLTASHVGPVVMVLLHLGNWEVLSSIAQRSGFSFHAFVLPLNNPVEQWVTCKVRKKLGVYLLPEGMAGVAPALKILKRGGMVSLACDEAFAGEIRGPFLGRPAHLRGNLALATRLARKTNAKLCIVHSQRTKSANFECHFSSAIDLPLRSEVPIEEAMLADVQLLNNLIEPKIKQHADQWYYLHEKL
jgi:Kdo2-lipid IVA lauroyltransferase/acyltransferase